MGLAFKERFKPSRFIQGEKPVHNSITLTHRRVFILPTKNGFGFVLLIIILLLIAFVYNNNLAYLLAFLLASIFFITISHSYKSLAALVCVCSPGKDVFAEEVAGFNITIKNQSAIERFNLCLSLSEKVFFSMKNQQQKQITLYSKTNSRGWHIAETITISSTYPLGIFRAWSPIQFVARVLVYPKPSRAELAFPEAVGQQEHVLQNSHSKGNDDFYGLKEYQAGDPIKHIHWKAFAKGQGLYSKQYESGQMSDIWLDYEQASGHNVEERLSQLCRWVIDAEKAGIHYGFSIPGFSLEIGHGKEHSKKCLEALALF